MSTFMVLSRFHLKKTFLFNTLNLISVNVFDTHLYHIIICVRTRGCQVLVPQSEMSSYLHILTSYSIAQTQRKQSDPEVGLNSNSINFAENSCSVSQYIVVLEQSI